MNNTDIVVERVANSRQRKLFLEFPWTIYRKDPHWIPPLRLDQKENVGYSRNPFYDRNQIQTFLAYRGGEVVGRIAAILNQGHINRYDDRRGFFGFFESIDDQDVANALFNAARDWFADQGIFKLRGPVNPSLNGSVALLIDGFDSPPTFMMTYNPRYYERLIENYGFVKAQDLYAFWGHISMLPKVAEKLRPLAEQIVERYNVKVRPLDKNHFHEEVKSFLSIYNRSLTNTWGFVPMSDAEVEHAAKSMQPLIVPELAIFVEIDGRLVGATVRAIGLQPANQGNRWPAFSLRLHPSFEQQASDQEDAHDLDQRPARVPDARTGVGADARHRSQGDRVGHGGGRVLLGTGNEQLLPRRLTKGGAKINKTYRIYDVDFNPADVAAQRQTRRRAAIHGRLEIRPVVSGRDLNDFLKVPWRIYAEDPQWVPQLMIDQKEFLNPRVHPFYLHGAAEKFIAYRDGVPQGRILVSDDPRYNAEHKTNTGCFGMFESADDPEMAQALLEAAAKWLRGRGRTAILGPIDYSTNYTCGLLVEGFDTPPRILDNHNPPYYGGLLESCGLAKAKDLFSWWFLDPKDMGAMWRERAERIMRRGKITIRSFNERDFENEVQRCNTVYNGAMVHNWGFVSLTEAEFRFMARQLKNWPSRGWCCWPRSTVTRSAFRSRCPTSTRPSGRSTAGCSPGDCRSISCVFFGGGGASRRPA